MKTQIFNIKIELTTTEDNKGTGIMKIIKKHDEKTLCPKI